MFGPFDGVRYGPWQDDRLPLQLREPYSRWSWARPGTYGGGPRSPVVAIVLGAVLVVGEVVLVVYAAIQGGVAGLIAALVPGLVLLPLGGLLLYAGSLRRAWVRRVKASTGMSPFEMHRKGVPPPGCDAA